VDIGDLGALATAWQSAGVWATGDFNYDNFVDISDLGALATNWQAGVGSPLGAESLREALASVGLPSSAVPEPATLGTLAVGLMGLLGARHRRRTRLARVTPACIAVVGGLSMATSASAFNITEDFTIDPGWDALNNRTAPQNYGWSNTDNTGTAVNPPDGTATGAGEIGGVIARAASPDNMYARDVGPLTMDEAFTASGVIHLLARDGGSGINMGFFDSANFYGSGGDAHSFAGFFWDDGNNTYALVAGAGGERNRSDAPASLNLPVGTTVPFSLTYDPDGNSGGGAMTLMINNVFYTHNLDGVRALVGTMNHFGLFAVSADGSSSEMYVDDLKLTSGVIVPPVPTWAVNASGDWNVASNWVGGVPNGVDAEARFLGAISAAQTVFTNTAITLGTLRFDNANTYVIGGAGSLNIEVSTGSALIEVANGNQKINLPLFFASNTDVTISTGATLTIADPTTIRASRTVTKAGSMVMQAALTLEAGAVLTLASGPTTLLGAPVLGAGAKVDVNNTTVTVDYRGQTNPAPTIRAQLASGYNAGAWNGPGIGTTAPLTVGGKTVGVGWKEYASTQSMTV
jgi:hypothetical protein